MKDESNVIMIDEIFCSIQGESSTSGLPTIFIRTFGCDVGCSFCDQPQNPKNRKKMNYARILSELNKNSSISRVCITGGEPLRQWNSVYPFVLELQTLDYEVSIETSGCYPIDEDPYRRSFNYVMDIKCPSSGVSYKNLYENLMRLQSHDEVKFVISDLEDYKFMKSILRKYPTRASILVSPCFNENNPVIGKDLCDWIIKDGFNNMRVQLQIHKIINVR